MTAVAGRRALVAPFLATLVVASSVMGAATAAATTAPPSPEIHLSTNDLVPGQAITIAGSGFAPGTTLVAVVCGGDAVEGTMDCAVSAATSLITVPGGSFSMPMTPAMPPRPCPCVVMVTEPAGDYRTTIPVTVAGAGTAPLPPAPQPAARPALAVSDVHVAGGLTLGSLFGAAAERTLSFTLHNPGTVPVDPVVMARWGDGDSPENVITVPSLRAVAPGQTVEVRAPFRLDAFSAGSYTVRVTVDQTGQFLATSTRSATTSTWPLGLFVLAVLVAALLVYALWRVLSLVRRRTGVEPAPAAVAD